MWESDKSQLPIRGLIRTWERFAPPNRHLGAATPTSIYLIVPIALQASLIAFFRKLVPPI